MPKTNKSLIDEDGEIWVDIPGYKGVYTISNYGRVKRLAGFMAIKNRILAWCYHKGYIMVTLSVNAKHNRIMVHIMVANLFIANPNNYPQVLHVDNNPSNPRFDNLIWGTQSMNIIQAHKQNRMGGEKHGNSVLNIKIAAEIKKDLQRGETVLSISRNRNIPRATIYNIVYGKTWKNLATLKK